MVIEIAQGSDTASVPAGSFSYLDEDGKTGTADFVVRCEPDPAPDNPQRGEICERRVDALNSQFVSAYRQLEDAGYRRILFHDLKPNPFF